MLKNIFLSLFRLLLLFLIVLFWFISVINVKKIADFFAVDKDIFLIIILVLEYLALFLFIHFFYQKPIKNLISGIKLFMWSDDSYKKFLKTGINLEVNYVVQFLKNIIFSLREIKDEFFHWKEIKSEVSLAKEIQWKMLSKKLLEIPSLNVVMSSKPAWEVWWDSYDIIKSDNDDNYYIYVWDATGHGVWAWFIMTMVNTLIEWFIKNYKSWADILAKTNLVLKPRLKANLLMSLLLVRWDEKEKRIFMTWAWHEYLIIYKQRLKKTFKVKSWWVALWMVKDISKIVKEVEVKVEPGDIIVLYSDWVTEAINRPKRDWTEVLFWEDRLVDAIQSAPEIPGTWYKSHISVYKNISITLSKFMWYKHTQLDDITLWVIQYKPQDYNPEKDFSVAIEDDFITEWKW